MPAAMIANAVQTKVMFRHPFQLPGMTAPQPAGTYSINTDQEELRGRTFTALRTIRAFLEVPALNTRSQATRQVPISLDDLDACVLADRTMCT